MRSIKYTNSKGSSVVIGAPPIPTTLEDGVVAKLSATNLPDWPDNASGTAWFRNGNFTTADISGAGSIEMNKYALRDISASSWDNTKLTISSGVLVYTANDAVDFLRFAIGAGSKTRRIQIKPASNCSLMFENDGDTYMRTLTGGVWNLVDVSFNATGSAWVTDISYFPVGVNYIAMDYIGDGSYTSKIVDLSGNGKTLSVYGATPVDTTINKALRFDGVNDTVTGGSFTLTDWTVSLYVKKANASQTGTFFAIFDANQGFYFEQYSNATSLWFFRASGGAESYPIAETFSTTTFKLLTVTYAAATKAVKSYIDGSLVGSSTLTNTPVSPTNCPATLNLGSAWAGELGMPSIYSRVLSAAEVKAIYTLNSAPYLANGETYYGVIESIDNIDVAESNVASTKAPVQDGSTYIDTLLGNREITVSGSLTVPQNIDTIYSQRKTITDVLNPKYGLGTLDFYYGKNSITRRTLKNVLVDKVSFPNKPYQSPFQSFAFTAESTDPYWYDTSLYSEGVTVLSGGSATFTVGGENDTPPLIRIYGSATNPSITNSTTGETIALTYSLAGGSYIDIDTRFGSKTIKLNGSTSLIGNLNIGSTFPRLQVGSNTVSYTGGGYIIIMWRNRYVGV